MAHEISLALLLCGICAAEISGAEPAPPLNLFALPAPTLSRTPVQTPVQAEEVPVEELIVVSEARPLSETAIQAYESMNGGPLLSRVESPPEPAGAIGWFETKVWDPVFMPEVVKLGKVKISGGVVAAVKRKNPFCLLNPLVFVASW